MQFIILIIFGYFLGAVPFGYMIGKAHGKDLRLIGSGNIGATNASRALGKKWGILCFFLDVLKGLIPMLLVPLLKLMGSDLEPEKMPTRLFLWLLVGCAAVLGHIFPVYLKFKGGKGVATSLGIVLGLFPYYTYCGLAAFIVWLITLLVWQYVSLSSIIASLCFPVFLLICIFAVESWKFSQLWPLLLMAILMAVLVVVRHTQNIKRLLEGSETKVGQ
jgi:glycerol-3-phosphate acyltransferase PlsY